MCFFVDLLFSLVISFTYYRFRNTSGMELPNEILSNNILAILGHGIGHRLVGRGLFMEGNNDDLANELAIQSLARLSLVEFSIRQVGFGIFWLGLLKASMPKAKLPFIVLALILAQAGGLFLPNRFGFTYVQTVLMTCNSFDQLLSKDKGFAYAMYPIIIGVPLTLVGWLESTECVAFVRDRMYGHVVYDAFIPVSLLLWYFLCYIRATSLSAAEHASQSTKIKSA